MAIGTVELLQEYSPKHSRMGTARMKYDKEIHEEGKKSSVSMLKSRAGMEKKRSPDSLSLPNQNTIIIIW